jgi:hypothetical protein
LHSLLRQDCHRKRLQKLRKKSAASLITKLRLLQILKPSVRSLKDISPKEEQMRPEPLRLSVEEVELALVWLEAPPGVPLPEKLDHLHPAHWAELMFLLSRLWEEKARASLH